MSAVTSRPIVQLGIQVVRAVRESMTSLWRHRSATGAAVVTTATALFVVLTGLATHHIMRAVSTQWGSGAIVVVLLEEGAPATKMSEIEGVGTVRNPSAVELAELLGIQTASSSQMRGEVLVVEPEKSPASHDLSERLESTPGVRDVRVVGEDLEALLSVAWGVGRLAPAAGALLVIAAAILIANASRLSIYPRRQEIEIMQLVGASRWFIRGPFVIEGCLTGALGGSVAAGAFWLFWRAVFEPAASQWEPLVLEIPPSLMLWWSLLVSVSGASIGAVASSMAVGRLFRARQ